MNISFDTGHTQILHQDPEASLTNRGPFQRKAPIRLDASRKGGYSNRSVIGEDSISVLLEVLLSGKLYIEAKSEKFAEIEVSINSIQNPTFNEEIIKQ